MGKGNNMGLMTVDDYCELVYKDEFRKSKASMKSKRNTVSRMCRDGVLDAVKSGRRWLIRLESR